MYSPQAWLSIIGRLWIQVIQEEAGRPLKPLKIAFKATVEYLSLYHYHRVFFRLWSFVWSKRALLSSVLTITFQMKTVSISYSCSETMLRSATTDKLWLSDPESQNLRGSCWVTRNIYYRQEDTDFSETPFCTFNFKFLSVWRHVHFKNIPCRLT